MSQKFKLPRITQLAASIALVAGGSAFVTAAHAAAPAAGTQISNIAAATYVDGNGNSKQVTSNEVKTTVLQVGSFTLIDDRTATANPGSSVSLSHTLTNTGNGTDTYTIAVAQIASPTDQFDLTNVNVYIDSNNDGTPDNNTPITSVTVEAGKSVGLIIVSTVPVTETSGEKAQYTLTVTSQYGLKDGTIDAGDRDSDTDTVTVANGSVISVNKSASVTTVADNGEITYTLTYRNTGNAVADNIVIEDSLDLGKVTYKADSGIWSGSATALTDPAGGDPTGISYKYENGKVQVVIASVAANTTGTVKFTVTANTANRDDITNVANYYDDDNANPNDTPPVTPTPSNQTVVERTDTFLGTINDSLTDNYSDAQKDLTVANKDNQIIKNTSQGTPITFGNTGTTTDAGPDVIVIHNTGNTDEVYNVTYALPAGFPAGTLVELLKSDGTPLTDSNGDSTVDTGPVAPGATMQILVKVTLPTTFNETSTATNVVTVTIDPIHNTDTNIKDTIDLVINNVSPISVDLHNGDGSDTSGSYSGASGLDTGAPVDSKEVAPGSSVNFPLAVTNNGSNPDNFNISASGLPNNWTVQYYLDANKDGVPDNTTPITNTGSIPAGGTVNLVAVVTPPADAIQSTSSIEFKVTSPVTGLSDVMQDQVTVKLNRNLVLEYNQSGDVAPGGTITYVHTLTNKGNITEGDDVGELNFTLTDSVNGWTSTVFVDLDNDGEADANELVTNGDLSSLIADDNGLNGIEPGESVRIIVKVQAPSTAVGGVNNATVFTIDPTDVSGITHADVSNTDNTKVNDGQVRLVKQQVLDANCDGTETAFVITNVSAKPGECVKYRITATNEGNLAVTNVKITDATPVYTTLVALSDISPKVDNATLNASSPSTTGAVGTLVAEQSSLATGATATLEFVVKVNN